RRFVVEANDFNFMISFASMIARTNDGFLGAKNLSTKLSVGESHSELVMAYDAGVEMNTESCDHIPAPPCGNPNIGTNGGEGFVHPHPGVQNIGDLSPLRDAFASTVAKIHIKRIQ